MSKIVESFQADLPTRTFRVTNGFNEAVYFAANEPSLGMYRLQEHVQTNVPRVVSQKLTLRGVSFCLKRYCSEGKQTVVVYIPSRFDGALLAS